MIGTFLQGAIVWAVVVSLFLGIEKVTRRKRRRILRRRRPRQDLLLFPSTRIRELPTVDRPTLKKLTAQGEVRSTAFRSWLQHHESEHQS